MAQCIEVEVDGATWRMNITKHHTYYEAVKRRPWAKIRRLFGLERAPLEILQAISRGKTIEPKSREPILSMSGPVDRRTKVRAGRPDKSRSQRGQVAPRDQNPATSHQPA